MKKTEIICVTDGYGCAKEGLVVCNVRWGELGDGGDSAETATVECVEGKEGGSEDYCWDEDLRGPEGEGLELFESLFRGWFLGRGIGGGCPEPRHRHINRDIDKQNDQGGRMPPDQSYISVPTNHGFRATQTAACDWR